jgi:hypothetical protein
LVCGSKCVTDRLRSDSTALLCEIPPHEGRRSAKEWQPLRNSWLYKDHSLNFFFQVVGFLGNDWITSMTALILCSLSRTFHLQVSDDFQFLFLDSTGVWTQGLMLTRQGLHQPSSFSYQLMVLSLLSMLNGEHVFIIMLFLCKETCFLWR